MMSVHHWLLGIAGEARTRSGVGVGPHVGLRPRGAGDASAPGEAHPDVSMLADHGDIGMSGVRFFGRWRAERPASESG
jgi:hypothetical protein